MVVSLSGSVLAVDGEYLSDFDLYLYPNTFYLETGPVIETPLSSAASTQELLIQSWGINNHTTNLVRLFPGVSPPWLEARFDGLRAEGGYTVSAHYEQGQTVALRITADRAGPLQLRFKSNSLAKLRTTQGSRWNIVSASGWQIVHVDLKKGESLLYGDQNGFNHPVVDVKSGQRQFHFGMNASYLSSPKTGYECGL